MSTNSRAGFLHECREVMAGVDLNTDDLAHVLSDRVMLGEVVVQIDNGIARQNLHQSQYQTATRDVEDAMAQGRELLVRIKNAIRATYGLRNEKLQEFGLTVRRFARRFKGETTPTEAGPTQPQPAPSETDGAIQK